MLFKGNLHYGNPPGARGPAPWPPPTNGVGSEAGHRKPLLATGCTGNKVRGREDVSRRSLSPFIIFLIPQTSCRAASAAGRPANEEGGTSKEPDHIQVQQNIRVAVFTQLLPISINLCLLSFGKCQERQVVNSLQALFV